MKKLVFLSATLLLLTIIIPTSEAVAAQSAEMAVCLPSFTVTTGASSGAGEINFCLYYPANVQPGSTFEVTSTLTAPPTTSPTFLTAAQAFTAGMGCTEGTPFTVIPTSNGGIGTMWTAGTFFTMTSEQCVFVASITLSVGVAATQIYSGGLAGFVATENTRVDNYNYLCEATGNTPNDFSTTATECNTPAINSVVSGNLTICPESSPCFIEGNLTNIEGNLTINQTNGAGGTVEITKEPSLFILLLVIVAVLAHLGELRRDNIYRVFSGFLLLITGFVPYWNDESALVGLDHMPLDFTILFTFICMAIAAYLMYPKEYDETET